MQPQSDTRTDLPEPPARDSAADINAVVVSGGAGAVAGAVAGLIWGGIGGRIAMRVALLTSDDRVRRMVSDDGFEIGIISPATIFLLIFAAIGGAAFGFRQRYQRGFAGRTEPAW